MKQTILAALSIVIVVALLAGVAVYYMRPSSAPAVQTAQQPSVPNNSSSVPIPSSSSQATAQTALAAYQAALSKDNVDNIKTYQTVVAGNYALQVWKGDVTSGQALLKFDTTKNVWVIVDPGGGTWNIADLVVMGVPKDTATALWKGLPH